MAHKKYLVLVKAVQGACMATVPVAVMKVFIAAKVIVAVKVSIDSV
jgi:hypothetical protein